MTTQGPQLSRVRTLLFGALAVVWFGEMALWGFPALSGMWGQLWRISPPADPQLGTALTTLMSLESPVKGALGVLAVVGLRSRSPATRTALFASMALVPPLNIAFPFRQQGFLLGPTIVATTLSAILWGSFFLFRERSELPEQGRTGDLPPSRWEVLQYLWFAANSAALTVLALLFLFRPRTGLDLAIPCLPSASSGDGVAWSSLVHKSMGTGTHLLAFATASWIATAKCRTNPTLRQALTMASAVGAGLFLLFPLRQIVSAFGGSCAKSSLLVVFAPLFVAWVLYAALTSKARPQSLEGP